jgi:hypothetical protein
LSEGKGGLTSEGRGADSVRTVTLRAVLIGLLAIFGVILLIHWAEIVLGGARGHTAMANTSIPVGTFAALLLLLALNGPLGRLRRRWQLSAGELVVIYSMTATATVLASSGAIHFLVPALAAPHHFASPENKWRELFFDYIPPWLGPTDERLLNRFFDGGDAVPVSIWLGPSLIWSGFVFVYALCCLSLVTLLRRQWVESERLTFPTVYVPLSVTAADGAFWRNRAAWVGMAIPFLIGTLNTLNLNFPAVPELEVRKIDLSQHFKDEPWSSMGGLAISFYPFVIGVAFLLSTEMTFSCWFFYLMTKVQAMIGGMLGVARWGTGSLTRFPFEDHQGAGAFLALTGFAIWVGRKYLGHSVMAALGVGRASNQDDPEGLAPRWAVWGLLASFAAMVAFCRVAGMSLGIPIILLGLSLVYLLAATRIRAETGNAWLFGPRVDPQTLMITTFGSRHILPRDLTIMAYLSSIATYDLRCASMPHQLDAFKLADARELPRDRLTWALVVGLAIGIPAAFWAGLLVWHNVGALAKGDTWRTMMGKQPFDRLQGYLQAPQSANLVELVFVAAGLLFTGFLYVMRTKLGAWPFHPVGYAMANTYSMSSQWFPFLLAWSAKCVVLRYGGAKLYRQAQPFFLGLVVGDLLNGALYTIVACFVDKMHVYPVNW